MVTKMDIDKTLADIHLRALLKKAHLGDAQARDEYQALIKEAHDKGDKYRKLYLCYLQQFVLRELLEAYVEELEKGITDGKKPHKIMP